MRGLRSFLGLLVILLALGAYLYFVESKREPGDAERRDRVFAVEASAIEEISVKSESGERTTLRKSGDDWQMVEPVATTPDSAEVSGLTTNLANLEVQEVIDENPADLDEYGLATPRVELTFKSGGQERRLLVGRKTPPGTDLYAKLADQPRVFLISSYLDSTFNKNTFDLRDKKVLKIEGDNVDALAISTPERTLRFTKAGGEWRLSAPIDARADSNAVNGIVSRLNTLQMKSIAEAEPEALADFGLDKPAATVQIGSGSSQATLLIGKSAGDGVVFAKDHSKPAVVTIESTLLDEIKKEPGSFRQQDLFDARAFNATHLEIVRNGQTLSFEKTTVKNKDGQDEERWRQVAPTAQDVDQTKLENLLSAITQARASSFGESTAKTGLDAPELTATVKSDEGRRAETVKFARTGADAYAARSGEGGAAELEASALDNILKALQELQQPAPAGGEQKPADEGAEQKPAEKNRGGD
jgi:Domain of unknown function (DUF4340)